MLWIVFSRVRRRRIHEARESDEHGGRTNETVQNCDKLRHLRHLHAPREEQTDRRADQQGAHQQSVVVGDFAEDRCQQRNGHADDAVPVTAPRGLLVGQAAKGKDEEDGGRDICRGDNSCVEA